MLLRRGEITPPEHAFSSSLQHQLQQVQDVSVVHPARHLGEQQVVPHAVEVRREINVYHSRLVSHDGLGHSVDRLLRCPLRSIPVRPLAKVGFEDRLHDLFERPLHHAVPNRRNSKHADLPRALGDLDAPVPQWPIGARDQFAPELGQKPFHAGLLDGREVTPSIPGAPLSCLASAYAAWRVSQLTHMDVQAPVTASPSRPSP